MTREHARGKGAARLPADALDRARLSAIIDGGHAMTIISGVAGSGKSTLLAQWIHAQTRENAAVIHVAFSGEIMNSHTVWRDILTQLSAYALVEDARGLADDVRGFDHLRDTEMRVVAHFSALLAPCVVVIDNFERSDEIPLLNEILRLLDAAPQLRVVIATRRSLTARALQMFADTDITFIGPKQLLFTEDEAREVIERISHHPAPEGSIGEISALPMAARMIGLSLLAHQWPLGLPETGRESVADALMSRLVSEDFSEDFREFLLCTALPSIVTVDIARRLGWERSAEDHLALAETYGLGMWQANADSFGFAYTPTLREALIREIEKRSPEKVRELHRVIAIWAFENKFQLEALTSGLASKDYHLTSRMVRKSWFVLSQSAPQEAVDLLKKQSPVVLAKYPVLPTVTALILSELGQRLRASGYYATAVVSMRRQTGKDADLTERLWTQVARTVAERFAGMFDRASASAEQFEQLYLAMDDTLRAQVEDTLSLHLSGCALSYLYAGRHDDAIRVLEWGMTIQVPDDDAGWYHCASTLAGLRALDGRLNDARRILQEIGETDPPVSWRTDLYGFFEQIAHTVLALADLDLARAQAHLDSVAHHMGKFEHWPFFVCMQSEVHLLAGRSALALHVLESARQRGMNSKPSAYAVEQMNTMHGFVSLSLGNPVVAESTIAALSPASPARRVLAGLRDLRSGQPSAAFTLLGGFGSGVEKVENSRLQVLALITFALAAVRMGSPDLATRAVGQAAAILEDERTLAPFLLFSNEDLVELKEASDARAADLIDQFLDQVTHDERAFVPLPEPVTLTTRELAVLRELVRTSSTTDIASALFVSPNTVKVQRSSAYRKLGVSSRADALIRAATLGLLTDESAAEEGRTVEITGEK